MFYCKFVNSTASLETLSEKIKEMTAREGETEEGSLVCVASLILNNKGRRGRLKREAEEGRNVWVVLLFLNANGGASKKCED